MRAHLFSKFVLFFFLQEFASYIHINIYLWSTVLFNEYLLNKWICFCCLASGTSRRPWVLGKVMEKEYCQAKKVIKPKQIF